MALHFKLFLFLFWSFDLTLFLIAQLQCKEISREKKLIRLNAFNIKSLIWRRSPKLLGQFYIHFQF